MACTCSLCMHSDCWIHQHRHVEKYRVCRCTSVVTHSTWAGNVSCLSRFNLASKSAEPINLLHAPTYVVSITSILLDTTQARTVSAGYTMWPLQVRLIQPYTTRKNAIGYNTLRCRYDPTYMSSHQQSLYSNQHPEKKSWQHSCTFPAHCQQKWNTQMHQSMWTIQTSTLSHSTI